MITHRAASLAEVRLMLDWAATEGWNPGHDDAEAFFAADPSGFFVATEDGLPVAAISVVKHSADFAFLGLYIVRPSHRGQGIGYDLWAHALKHAEGRTVGLDGVPDQQENYAISGFAHAGGTTRYTGMIPPAPSAAIRAAEAEDISELIAREAEASGQRKAAYLRAWFTGAASRHTLLLETHGRIDGFCTVRRCQTGLKIGPLVTDSLDAARALMGHASSLFQGDVSIDVPQSATALTQLCRQLRLTPGFDTARMYRGPFNQPATELYAVASLELG